jgi:hypothetical protein
MYLSQRHLSRRTMLRGVGATVALPFLEAMLPAGRAYAKSAAAGKVRFAAIEMVHGSAGATVVGTEKHMWSPVAAGRTTRPHLDPLERGAGTSRS